ncbi:MAG: HsdM family class I SAM-dependent methyltransferase, partial [Promethearchaeota archaeon]
MQGGQDPTNSGGLSRGSTFFPEIFKLYSCCMNYLFKEFTKRLHDLYERDDKFKHLACIFIRTRANFSLTWTWDQQVKSHAVAKFYTRVLDDCLPRNVRVTCNNTSQFWSSYRSDRNFREAINDKLRENCLAVDWIDRLILIGIYLILNRFLFLKISSNHPWVLEILESLTGRTGATLKKYNGEIESFSDLMYYFKLFEELFPRIFQYWLLDEPYFTGKRWFRNALLWVHGRLQGLEISPFRVPDFIGNLYETAMDIMSKKIRGIFYTDPSIVSFILGKLKGIDESKKILDPACGSGEFLLGYLDKIKKLMLKKNRNIDEISKALQQNIWGIDRDPLAVQISAVRLFFKALPCVFLNQNVYRADALHLNILGMKHAGCTLDCCDGKLTGIWLEGFDVILGNPPFFVINKRTFGMQGIMAGFEEIQSSNLNVSSLFLYKFTRALRPGGQLAFLLPRSFLHVESFKQIRRFVLNHDIKYIFDLGRAFKNVGLQQIILILQNTKTKNNKIHYALLDKDDKQCIFEKINYDIDQEMVRLTRDCEFQVFAGIKSREDISGNVILEKARKESVDIYTYVSEISRGLGIQRLRKPEKSSTDDMPVIGGKDIFRFGIKKAKSSGYIKKSILMAESSVSRALKSMLRHKIMLQNLVSSKIRIVGTYDGKPSSDGCYCLTLDTITNLYPKNEEYARFVLAVLSSEFVTWILRDFIFMRQTLTIH